MLLLRCESSLGAENRGCCSIAFHLNRAVAKLKFTALSSWMLPGPGCFMESWAGRGEVVLLGSLAECT